MSCDAAFPQLICCQGCTLSCCQTPFWAQAKRLRALPVGTAKVCLFYILGTELVQLQLLMLPSLLLLLMMLLLLLSSQVLLLLVAGPILSTADIYVEEQYRQRNMFEVVSPPEGQAHTVLIPCCD